MVGVNTPTVLTPEERQAILRKLKHGPVTTRDALVEYANKVCQEVLSKRVKESE